ncbi:MAG TPA: S1 RNA-binding domain-containing protein, partial [Polyangiaceae bacterium]|nr:S1 RNA-binding domain-containing protein [Polyangiaceae bacterium]
KKGDDVEAIILSINHDEKKVSLGVKQLWDDPWPTIFNELPPGKAVTCRVLSIVDYGVFVQVREGVEGLIPQADLVLPKDESGKERALRVGEELEAEIANIDTQERRITLSMRRGEAVAAAAATTSEAKPATPRAPSKAPKKTAAAEALGGTIGELIKQKLGDKLAAIGTDKKEEE